MSCTPIIPARSGTLVVSFLLVVADRYSSKRRLNSATVAAAPPGNLVSIGAEVERQSAGRHSRPRRSSHRHFLHRIRNIRPKHLGGKGDGCANSFRRQAGMLRQDLVRRLSRRQLVQDQFNVIRVPASVGLPIMILGSETIRACAISVTIIFSLQHRAVRPTRSGAVSYPKVARGTRRTANAIRVTR